MKRVISAIALTMLSLLPLCSQSESSIIYYSPLTRIAIDIEYDELTDQAGMFCQYAERYLGVKADIVTNKSYFMLRRLSAAPIADADTSRAFVLSDKDLASTSLRLTAHRTLAGINIGESDDMSEYVCQDVWQQQPAELHTALPLLEEQMQASSTAKMAEATAKLIYRLREARLALLAGEAEHGATDGTALQTALAEIDRQEQQLVALFLGKRTTTTHKKTICYTPRANTDNEVLFRFSTNEGVVAADNLIGEPYMVSTVVDIVKAPVSEKKSSQTTSPFTYLQPGYCVLTLTDLENNQLLSLSCKVAQLGIVRYVAPSLIKANAAITLSPLTGEILSIQHKR